MTKRLEKSFKKPALAPVDDECQWNATFASFPDKLEKMADQALEELRAGRTREMGFDEL